MKNKKNLLLLPAAAIIVFSVFSGFAPQSGASLVEECLRQRTEILQDGFYGKTDPFQAKTRLFQIETDPLLFEDTENLENWQSQQLDRVKEMTFLSIEEKGKKMGNRIYDVSISWSMEGVSRDYTMRGDYYVVMKKEGERYKLSQFVPR